MRTPDSTTVWQRLHPALHLLNSTLRRKHHKSHAVVMQPAAGGRCRKRPIVCEPATEPIRFRMGIGPALNPTGLGLAYYRRPDHLRTNRAKNRHPGQSKRLVCNTVKGLDYQQSSYCRVCKLPSGRRLGTTTTLLRARTAAVQTSRDLSDSISLLYVNTRSIR